jgi:hypothetical protein
MTTYYKCLAAGGKPANGGAGVWSLPVKNKDGTWQAGDWMPHIEDIELCRRGYHACEWKDVLRWGSAELYIVELGGKVIIGDDKVVAQTARLLSRVEAWNDRTLRLFACDCAERVLPTFECKYPDDKRPRLAIETARRYANGAATLDELAAASAAASAAAWAAASAAASAAAWAAASAAAWAAARDVAFAAARNAACDAARAATMASEVQWQFTHLVEMLGVAQ